MCRSVGPQSFDFALPRSASERSFLTACSGLEQSEREKARRRNCKGEYIYRNKGDFFYPIAAPASRPPRALSLGIGVQSPPHHQGIFPLQRQLPESSHVDPSDPAKPLPCSDCEGSRRHGLPIIQGKEGVYPILLDLLNYLQKKTGKRVIITCGHRCPAHNTYSDPSRKPHSKHQIGAEVDFYVQGMEERPQEIAGLLMQYYQETPSTKTTRNSLNSSAMRKPDTEIQPWMNKEIFIKLYQKKGRAGHATTGIPIPISPSKSASTETRREGHYRLGKANQGYPRG